MIESYKIRGFAINGLFQNPVISFLILAWFIPLYFYIIPQLVICALAVIMELKDTVYRNINSNTDKQFYAAGKLKGHSVQLYLMKYYIFPVLDIIISPEDQKEQYEIYFMESFYKDIFKYGDEKYIIKKVTGMFNFQTRMRPFIGKLLNKKLRDSLNWFIKNRIILDIYGNHILLKYRFYMTPLILLFKLKYFKKLVREAVWLSEHLKSGHNAEILIENIKIEQNEDLIILNLMLLYMEKQGNTDVFKQYESSSNKALSIVARCGVKSETYEDIEYLIKQGSKRDRYFAEENMPCFRLAKEQKKELLVYSIYSYGGTSLVKSFNSLLKVCSECTEKIVLEYINYREHESALLDYMEKISLLDIIGENKFISCFNYIVRTLQNSGNDEGIENNCISAFEGLDDIRAVDYLLPLTTGSHAGYTKKKAREAVNRLQRNVPTNQKGALSVSGNETEGGELSISGDGGELTVKEE